MMYEGPITLVTDNMKVHIDGEILKAVQNIGINIDRAELLRALAYDRDQYKKGYADRDDEIVRCKDCKWAEKAILDEYCVDCAMMHTTCAKHGYCHHGERREP